MVMKQTCPFQWWQFANARKCSMLRASKTLSNILSSSPSGNDQIVANQSSLLSQRDCGLMSLVPGVMLGIFLARRTIIAG